MQFLIAENADCFLVIFYSALHAQTKQNVKTFRLRNPK